MDPNSHRSRLRDVSNLTFEFTHMGRTLGIGAGLNIPVVDMDADGDLDIVVIDGQARGIIARNLVTGELSRHEADTVVLATGGYGNVFFPAVGGPAPG